jgi:hypothetical protein
VTTIGRPRTRPHPLDDGISESIANRLVTGESIRSICSDADMPAETMFYQAMAKDEEFRSIIAGARVAQQDASVEQCIEIADEATPETVNVARLRIWARQWRAGKLAFKKYGDRVVQENVGADGGPMQVESTRTVIFLPVNGRD